MGAIASAIFGVRNIDKAAEKGDYGRTFAAAGQSYNALSGLAQLQMTLSGTANPLGKGIVSASQKAKGLIDKVDTYARREGVLGTSAKGMQYASKAVNPLLCAAAGYRVVTDEDWQSAAVEETCAMGGMFLAERGAKIIKSPICNDVKIINSLNNGKLKTLLAEKAEAFNKISNRKLKFAAIIASEILFVCASVLAFGAGKEIGKKITGRDNIAAQQDNTGQADMLQNPFVNFVSVEALKTSAAAESRTQADALTC